jgi:hypothetical protein
MNIAYSRVMLICMLALSATALAGDPSPPQNAVVPDSGPLAPTAANFLPVVRLHARSSSRIKHHEPIGSCVDTHSMFNENPDGPGDMGAGYSPGLAVYTVPLKSGGFGTPRTEASVVIERLTELAKAGYLAKKDISLTNTLGNPSPAVEFTMTKAGWLRGRSGCFSLGGEEAVSIVSATRVTPDPNGVVAYDVKYSAGLRNLDAWAIDPARIREIRQRVAALTDKTNTVRLYLGKQGWLPASLTGAVIEAGNPVLDLSIDDIVPPINAEIIKGVISGLTYKACLRLPSVPGEDAVEVNNGTTGQMSATYLNGTKAYPETDRHKAWRRRLDGLAKSGLFLVEKLPANPDRNRPAGVRYTLSDQYAPYLDNDSREKGCMNLGRTNVDMIVEPIEVSLYLKGDADRPFKIGGKFFGLMKIADDAWSRSIDMSGAPEAAAMLKDGFAINTHLKVNNGKWVLEDFEVTREHMLALNLRPRKRPEAPIEELAPKATGGTEVHIVSIYGANDEPVDVEVNRTKKPVILVLGSYAKTVWRVSTKPGAKASHVVLMGHGTVAIKGPRPQIAKIPVGLPHTNSGLVPTGAYGSIGIAEIEQLFGRRPDSWQMAYEGVKFVVDGVGVFGEVKQPEEAQESALAKLDQAVKAKVLRRATLDDAAAWIHALKKKYELQNRAAPNIPPDLENAYVVLKKFSYPAGLRGSNSATFYIPHGVPLPTGNSGQSRVYDLNSITLECSLNSPCGEKMSNGTIGAGATQSSYRIDSGSPKTLKGEK